MKRVYLSIPIMTPEDINRFWNKVDKRLSKECWPWIACIDQGYGRFSLNGSLFKATRIAYYLEVGQDPGENLVCHRCNHPICCNPSHLYVGDDFDNAHDKIAAGTEIRGEINGRVQLTEIDVLRIRLLYKTLEWTQQSLADYFGVGHNTIHCILARKTWKHV